MNMRTKFYIRSFTHSWNIRGYPKNFGSHVTGPRPFFGKNNYGDLFRLSLWISVPFFCIRSFTRSWDIRGYPKNFRSHVTPAMPNFWEKKLFRSVSLVPAKTSAKLLVYSFIRSKDITPNRMHVLACKMPEMHPKIVFWGLRVGKFDTLMLRPPRKSITSETRHSVQKRRRYVSPSVL